MHVIKFKLSLEQALAFLQNKLQYNRCYTGKSCLTRPRVTVPLAKYNINYYVPICMLKSKDIQTTLKPLFACFHQDNLLWASSNKSKDFPAQDQGHTVYRDDLIKNVTDSFLFRKFCEMH